jgi:hypothetical protein
MVYFVVILVYFPRFGILYQEKSGNFAETGSMKTSLKPVHETKQFVYCKEHYFLML